MGRCEYCKKNSNAWKNLSYFMFPKDEAVKLQWVKNMGRKNWIPGQHSRLCADHFAKVCIDTRNTRNRLHRGAIPTIFAHLEENDPSLHTNMRYLESAQLDSLAGPSGCIQDSQEPDPIETSLQIHESIKIPVNIMIGVNHDHSYHETFDTQKHKLNDALKKINKLSMKNDRLKVSQRRVKKTISTLRDLLSNLPIFFNVFNQKSN